MNNSVKSVAVMSVIALLCGVLLAFFHQLTNLSPEEQLARETAKLNALHEAQYTSIEYFLNTPEGRKIKAFYKAEDEDFYIVLSTGKGKGGIFEVFVCISGGEIVDFSIGENKESAGYPQRMTNADNKWKFLLDINSDFRLKNNGGDVDSVASATLTAQGVAEAIGYAAQYYQSYMGEQG